MIAKTPPIYGPPNNNSRNEPAAPIIGIDGRMYCPGRHADGRICHAQLHRTRTPAACPECLQPLIREVKP
jgi:hypothetical protein